MTEFIDKSDKPRHSDLVDSLFDNYTFDYHAALPLNRLPLQRCSDDKYITDQKVLNYYRNLDYRLIEHIDYENKVIGGMVRYSFWLVTSMSQHGIKSPLNMYNWENIHPGKKRYIIANYLQLPTVPVLSQHQEDEHDINSQPIANRKQLDEIYGSNYSTRLQPKMDGYRLECSWHGETQRRDHNGYDDWYSASSTSIGDNNWITDYLLTNGLHIKTFGPSSMSISGKFTTHINNETDSDFYIVAPQNLVTAYDLWQLYYHFDPRYSRKTDTSTGISIINKRGDPSLVLEQDLRFEQTLARPLLLYKD